MFLFCLFLSFVSSSSSLDDFTNFSSNEKVKSDRSLSRSLFFWNLWNVMAGWPVVGRAVGGCDVRCSAPAGGCLDGWWLSGSSPKVVELPPSWKRSSQIQKFNRVRWFFFWWKDEAAVSKNVFENVLKPSTSSSPLKPLLLSTSSLSRIPSCFLGKEEEGGEKEASSVRWCHSFCFSPSTRLFQKKLNERWKTLSRWTRAAGGSDGRRNPAAPISPAAKAAARQRARSCSTSPRPSAATIPTSCCCFRARSSRWTASASAKTWPPSLPASCRRASGSASAADSPPNRIGCFRTTLPASSSPKPQTAASGCVSLLLWRHWEPDWSKGQRCWFESLPEKGLLLRLTFRGHHSSTREFFPSGQKFCFFPFWLFVGNPSVAKSSPIASAPTTILSGKYFEFLARFWISTRAALQRL